MQSAYDTIEKFLFPAHVLEISRETILPVNQIPYIATIVWCIGLLIQVNIEVFALIIFDVFHVPYIWFIHSLIECGVTLGTPLLYVFWMLEFNQISSRPFLWNVLFVTPTYSTATTFTHFFSCPKWTLILDIYANYAEKLSLDERLQCLEGVLIDED
jgi:hypothetical protein